MAKDAPPGPTLPVDNLYYDSHAKDWWDDTKPLSGLRGANPLRFGYFKRILTEELGRDPSVMSALDVGCGGGLLAEEFSRLGCKVTGVDPSAASLDTARAHALASSLDVIYQVATGEHLPFEAGAFDIVYCCDVLEHVDDVSQVLKESARVLKPGGVYFYDTINRTWMSKLVLIKFGQEWRMTRMFDTSVHDWAMFIKPAELDAMLREAGLLPSATVGMKITDNPLNVLMKFIQFKRGRLAGADLARGSFGESPDLSMLYMGYAIKG